MERYNNGMATIEPVRPGEVTAALELALARTPLEHRSARVQHCLHLVHTGVLAPGGVWVARQGGAIVGVQVCVPVAGATCLFWLPMGEEADALVAAGLRWCRANRCKLAQALVGAADWPLVEPLIRAGFHHVTQMHTMQHDLADVRDEPVSLLRYEAYRPSLAAVFADTLQRTYGGTLDCPELNGKRTIDEILAGHRGQGKFHPECWWLVSEADRPVGVVLMTEMPDGLTWELMYLGLVPEARRHGHGRAMTLHALHWLREQPATHLTLSVDHRNRPARQLYQSLGFVETDCQEVLLFFFDGDRDVSQA
jgi:ribosomal protein S18 acetylase RimI-like enzyme